jgi:hypothetical protein
VPRNKLSDPHDPDCAVQDCRNIGFRHYLCEKHYKEIPASVRRDWTVDYLSETFKIRRRHDRQALSYFEGRLRSWGQMSRMPNSEPDHLRGLLAKTSKPTLVPRSGISR